MHEPSRQRAHCRRGRPPRGVPPQARRRGDARADRRRRRPRASRRRPALRRPGAPRDAPALGPAPGARRRRGLVGGPQRDPAGPQGQPPRRSHRGPSARVPRVRGRHPEGLLRRRARCASGIAAPTRSTSSTTTRSRSPSTASACSGRYGLFPLKARKGEPPGKDWMIHRMDPPADPTREPMPEHVKPMLAKPGALPPDDDALGLSRSSGTACARWPTPSPGRIRFESRNGNDITASYPELKALNRALSSHHAILDGEIVAFDDARPAELRAPAVAHARQLGERRASGARRRCRSCYVVFDLLWLDGHPLHDLPYAQRRARLQELGLEGATWQTPDHVVGDGAAVLAASLAQRPRGRRRQAPGQPLRARPALAVLAEGQELAARGRRRRRLAARRGQAPRAHRRAARRRARGRAACATPGASARASPRPSSTASRRCSSSARTRRSAARRSRREHAGLRASRRASRRSSSPSGRRTACCATRPTRGCARRRRASAFLDAGTPVRDGVEVRVGGRTLKVTNLDKVLYPVAGLTKRDVIEYYVAIAPAILAHLEGRPLTRVRFPNGVEGKSFFEKQCPSSPARVGAGRAGAAVGEDRRVLRLRRPADARLAGEPRGARAAHAAAPRGGARSSARR